MSQERNQGQDATTQQNRNHIVPAEHVAQISKKRTNRKAEQPDELKADIAARVKFGLEAPDGIDYERE